MDDLVPVEGHGRILERLHVPEMGTLPVLIDTDTYNEVDDQFALVFALRSSPRLDVQAVYAAPFHWPGPPIFNTRSTSPEDGMERSFDEIARILGMIDRSDVPIHRGSRSFLAQPGRPVESDAVHDLIDRVMSTDTDTYVLALAALTNIASALLLEPRIREKMVVVWLGGNPLHWPDPIEFNLIQDLIAVRTVLDSGVPLIHIPCSGVASHLSTTSTELDVHIDGRSEIGTYLSRIVREYISDEVGKSKVIWDIATVAHVVNPGWVLTVPTTAPHISSNARWSIDQRRHPMFAAYWIDRDAVFGELFRKINQTSV